MSPNTRTYRYTTELHSKAIIAKFEQECVEYFDNIYKMRMMGLIKDANDLEYGSASIINEMLYPKCPKLPKAEIQKAILRAYDIHLKKICLED